MSNARAIFWLIVLTLAALAANIFLSWRTPAVRSLPRRTLLDASFVPTRLAIERRGSPGTVLEKRGRWQLTQPYSATVDAQVVLRLVDQLTVTPVASSMTAAELTKLGRSRADFGLDEPPLSLSVSDGDETVSLSFGEITPSSNGVYVAIGGSDSLFVVPAEVRRAADVRAEAFREREIFPYDPEFVLDFDLRPAGETLLSFTRDGDGWKVGETAASSSKVKAFLARLTEATAVDFLWPVGATNEETTVSEARLVGYGLDAASAISVTLRCRDGVDRRLLIGNDVSSDKSYALVHDGGAIVTIDASLKKTALEGTRTFVDARLFPLEESSVSSYTLTEGDVTYVVARAEEGAWRLDAPVVAPADAQFAALVLRRILALTPFDRSKEGLKVSISKDRESCVVPFPLVLGTARPEDLRSSEIMNVDSSLVKRLVSTPGDKDSGAPVSIVYSRERKTWNVENGEEKTVDAARVEAIVSSLSPLKAARIETLKVAASDLPRYGLEHPRHTLSIDQEKDGAVRRNIFIGAETEGGYFATVGSSEAIFVLPKATVETLVSPILEL